MRYTHKGQHCHSLWAKVSGSADLLAVTPTFLCHSVHTWCFRMKVFLCQRQNVRLILLIRVVLHIICTWFSKQPSQQVLNPADWRALCNSRNSKFWVCLFGKRGVAAEVNNRKKGPAQMGPTADLTRPERLGGICISFWWKLNWQVIKGFSLF